ncbi:MAG: response regulator [Sulfuricurvum sp.]|jgi:PAS domain S-box-containing protein|uniref:response regulator n=1 Tax=Sulfuricurvum sp. TaxID=2025608 RepID=UPI0025D87420|nr:response regulator [Sulfuricurvum sp.]MCK9372234.1 response regulator [Sulfuricurvum sp.]
MNVSVPLPLLSVFFVTGSDPYDCYVADFLKTKISSFTLVKSGREALSLLRGEKPDIIITNRYLPDMNGLDFAERIRELSAELPLVIVTGDSDIQTLQRAIDIGVSKYLIKPLECEAVLKTLLELGASVQRKKLLKEDEKLLREYKNAFDAATIITKTDKEGIITYVNEEFVKISGYAREELIGLSHSIIRHPDTPIAVFIDMWRTIKAKKIWKGRIKNRTKNGGFYIVDATIVPILDSNEEVDEYLAIRQDVTRLIELEEKERQKLEQKLAQDHHLELVEEVNKAKTSFLLIFTHELKTPLNAIINFSDYLRREIGKTDLSNGEKLANLAGLIRENGYDMLNTVTTLLDLAKLQSHRLVIQSATFDLGDLIRSQVERSSSLIHQNKITVTINASASRVKIMNDPERVRQIFSNIFSNAIKYGGEKIAISYDEEGDYFWLSVEDNGPGIKNREGIFELFNQGGEDDLTRSSKGTGIGLYFVKTFCDHLGLSVSAGSSATLGGALFSVRGPILFHPKGTV